MLKGWRGGLRPPERPQGSPASSSVWREDPGLLSRPCRKRRPSALAQIAPFFPPGTAMWTSGLQGRRGQPGLAVTLAPKQRWGPGWSSASRRTPGPVPSTPEPLLEDQWPHVGMEASIDQVDCPGGGVGPQMEEGLWRAGPWRDLGSLETPRCVWLWVSASLSIKPGNWAQWPEAPLPG